MVVQDNPEGNTLSLSGYCLHSSWLASAMNQHFLLSYAIHRRLPSPTMSSCREEQEGTLFAVCIKIPKLAPETFWSGNTLLAPYWNASSPALKAGSANHRLPQVDASRPTIFQTSSTLKFLITIPISTTIQSPMAYLQERHKPAVHLWKSNATAV